MAQKGDTAPYIPSTRSPGSSLLSGEAQLLPTATIPTQSVVEVEGRLDVSLSLPAVRALCSCLRTVPITTWTPPLQGEHRTGHVSRDVPHTQPLQSLERATPAPTALIHVTGPDPEPSEASRRMSIGFRVLGSVPWCPESGLFGVPRGAGGRAGVPWGSRSDPSIPTAPSPPHAAGRALPGRTTGRNGCAPCCQVGSCLALHMGEKGGNANTGLLLFRRACLIDPFLFYCGAAFWELRVQDSWEMKVPGLSRGLLSGHEKICISESRSQKRKNILHDKPW